MDELTLLKQQADQLGLTYSNNIGLETLRARIKAKLEGTADPTVAVGAATTGDTNAPAEETEQEKRLRIQQEQLRLVRLRITNMDPSKADLRGEIITVQNRYIGTVKKFVPFGEATENGYHVPWCIYQFLLEKKFNQVKTRAGADKRQIKVEQRMVREYSLEVLPPLTQAELSQLAAAQAARLGLDDTSTL
jgi:hypothetical protein